MARKHNKADLTKLQRVEQAPSKPVLRPPVRTKVAVQKAASVEPPETRASRNPATHHDMRHQLVGSLCLVMAGWLLLALVLAVLKGENHPLGPFLGTGTARLLVWMVGSLPALLLPVVLTILGLRLISGKRQWWQKALFLSASIWLHSVLFLSLPGVVKEDLSPEVLSLRGGMLGQILDQAFLRPVFGAHWFGPALLLLVTLASSVFLIVGVAPRYVYENVSEFLRTVFAQVHQKIHEEKKTAEQKKAELSFIQGGAMILGVEPKGRFLDRNIRPEPEDGNPLPMDADLLLAAALAPAPKPKRGRTPLMPGESLRVGAQGREPSVAQRVRDRTVARDTQARAGASQDLSNVEEALEGKALDVYRNLSHWRPLQPEDLVGLNPLEIRELKRRDEELRRAAQLNEWEDRDIRAKVARRPRIQPEAEDLSDVPVPPISELSAVRPSPEPTVLPTERTQATEMDSATEEQIEIPRSVVRKSISSAKSPRNPGTPDAAGRYRIPDCGQLPEPPALEHEVDELRLQEMAASLELQLKNFGVSGRVLQIEPGPVITRFKIELAPGTPVRKISNLSEDLALALRARRIRIQAPIPGESCVGVEIPNMNPETVHIKELLRAPQFRDPKMKLPVVLGKDTQGNPAFTDLSRAPHLLIAGQTGSGKSVCINTIMCSFLFSQSPERLRMILIDPKVVELSTYANIPHLMSPVITRPEEAVQALKWTAVEMDRRYEVLAQAGVRNIAGFNDKLEAGTLPDTMAPEDAVRMPYLLLVIDEFADLMMVAGKEVETNVARVAQKARAVGIHMILATQRPSTNVITGVIKANLPTRIAFQVASQIDARTILDKQGAEDLLGRGDMLFRGIEAPEPMRIHGAFVTDADAEFAATAASSQGIVFPMIESFDVEGEALDDDLTDAPMKFDAKFYEAARLVAVVRQGSVSMLQRKLEIGFARAGRLIDQLERMGIVGKDRGSKAREVLMDEMQIEDLVRRLEEGY